MLRVASVSFDCGKKSFLEFTQCIDSILQYAAERCVEIITFPEYLTACLVDKNTNYSAFTERYVNLFSELAKKYNIYIAAGTHPSAIYTQSKSSTAGASKKLNEIENNAYFFMPNGSYEVQAKIHLVPGEPFAGKKNTVTIFNHPKAKLAQLVCYDIEFPEIVRAIAKTGVDVILVPTYTTDQQADCRVSFCAQARCIENHLYVVKAPLVGVNNDNSDCPQGYGKAQIFSPCDISFPPKGLVAEGPLNQTFMAIGDLNIEFLKNVREHGSTTPLKHVKSSYKIESKNV